MWTREHNVPDLEDGCPWAEWTRPNIKYCEHNLCAYITAPSNTWSNLAYIVVAWMVLQRGGGPMHRWFALALVFVGVTSFMFHASYTLAYQFGDFLGMFAFCALPLAVNLRRAGYLSKARQSLVIFFMIAAGTAAMLLMYKYELNYQLIVVAFIIGTIFLECLICTRNRPRRPRRRELYNALMLLAVAFAFSLSDMLRVYCRPHSVLQLHAIWHIVSAFALLRLYVFYADNFDLDSEKAVLLPLRIASSSP